MNEIIDYNQDNDYPFCINFNDNSSEEIDSKQLNYIENKNDIISYNNYPNSFITQYENLNTNFLIILFKSTTSNEDENEEENKNVSNHECILEREKGDLKSPKNAVNGQVKEKKFLCKKHKYSGESECKKNNTKTKNKKFITEFDSQRKIQMDNYSIKLFKAINDWVIFKIQNQIPDSLSQKKKINPPDYDVFTHNTNLLDIRFFLDIQYKNILQMTKQDKEKLDQLLILLNIKKPILLDKKKETDLNDKEYDLAKKLLIKESQNSQLVDITSNMMIQYEEIDDIKK